jgi:catechol 2,3-dioxygenase-like lactoylglutathione lyase family enzyme
MAKLRHIAITVPDPWKAAEFYMRVFGMKKVGETDWANASGVYLSDGTIKYRDPNGVVVDITANGWVGAVKDAPKPAGKARSRRSVMKRNSGRTSLTRD